MLRMRKITWVGARALEALICDGQNQCLDVSGQHNELQPQQVGCPLGLLEMALSLDTVSGEGQLVEDAELPTGDKERLLLAGELSSTSAFLPAIAPDHQLTAPTAVPPMRPATTALPTWRPRLPTSFGTCRPLCRSLAKRLIHGGKGPTSSKSQNSAEKLQQL